MKLHYEDIADIYFLKEIEMDRIVSWSILLGLNVVVAATPPYFWLNFLNVGAALLSAYFLWEAITKRIDQ